MPHPCARQTTNAPNQTPCHRTQTAPPTHLRMRRAKTTNKHNTTNNKQTHHHRNAPDGTLLAAPTLTQPAKPRRIPRRDQRGRNTQTAKTSTHETHTTRRNTPNHHAHAHTTDTNQSAPHLSLLAARPSALPRPERRTQASTSEARPTHTHATKRRHANAEKYHERGAENQRGRGSPPPPSLPPRLAARRRRGSLALALSRSLSLSSALTPRASRRSPLAGGNRHACNHATRQAARTAAAQRETVPRSRRRVPTPAALGARA